MQHEILLFVMPGCSICPQMERLFHEMHRQGAIRGLKVLDVTRHPELAEKYKIRSVPFYIINGVGFNGLKTRPEIEHLLAPDSSEKWKTLLTDGLSNGELHIVEQQVRNNPGARDAMLQLLDASDTELVVRIGLTAIIETLAEGTLLHPYEQRFIRLAQHKDKRIALDGLYYLSLLSTPTSLEALTNIANEENHSLQQEARELLAESDSSRILH